MSDKIVLATSGTLTLKADNITLKDIEEFCAEARKFGLEDNSQLKLFRQSVLGPVVSWHFNVPVEPKKAD